MSKRILCVCLGNICRSPAAEAVLRALGADVDSAGTAGWHVGKAPYGPMTEAGHRRDLAMDHLRARQFDVSDFTRFDLLLVMDRQNREDVEALRPEGNTTPVQMFHEKDVPDPYYTRDFEGALDIIERAARRWV